MCSRYEYTEFTSFNIKKKITLDYPKSTAQGLFPEFETAVVNESSVFEPLKFYCIIAREIIRKCKLLTFINLTIHHKNLVYIFTHDSLVYKIS